MYNDTLDRNTTNVKINIDDEFIKFLLIAFTAHNLPIDLMVCLFWNSDVGAFIFKYVECRATAKLLVQTFEIWTFRVVAKVFIDCIEEILVEIVGDGFAGNIKARKDSRYKNLIWDMLSTRFTIALMQL